MLQFINKIVDRHDPDLRTYGAKLAPDRKGIAFADSDRHLPDYGNVAL